MPTVGIGVTMKALVGFAALAFIMAGSALLAKPQGATPRMATF
jgi:hypothetical protein